MLKQKLKPTQILIEQELANKAADNEAADPDAIATMENWIMNNNLAEAATVPVREEDSTSRLFAKHAHLFDPNPSKIHKPSSDAELKDREIGGLWPHPNPQVEGETLYNGDLRINGEKHSVVYFRNKFYKPHLNLPEYRIYWDFPKKKKALIK